MNRVFYLIAAALLLVLEANLLGLATLLIGRCFHLKIFNCHFFCFSWVLGNGKLNFMRSSFTPVPEIVQGKLDLTQNEDWTLVAIKLFLQACFAAIVWVLTRPIPDGKMRFILVCAALLYWVISLYLVLHALANGGGALGRLVKTETVILCNSTEPISQNLKPLNELPYKYTPYEASGYQLLRATQFWYSGKIEEMKEPIQWLEDFVNREYGNNQKVLFRSVMSYYLLLTYYFVLEPDLSKAAFFYERVKPLLLQDRDANGKRLQAYYQYYIERNASAALRTARQAQQLLTSFGTPGREREMERHLIDDLLELLEKKAIC